MLWSENTSGEHAKLHNVAASNIRDHRLWSLFASANDHIQHWLRGCNNIPSSLQQTALIAHFLWRLHLALPLHPGHSTTLLQSKSTSGTHTKLHTVAASNNRDHMPWSHFAHHGNHIQLFTMSISRNKMACSVCYYLFVPHIYRCYSLHTSNATLTKRLQQ